MTDVHALADLIRRVPVLAIDIDAARRAGDHAALAYAAAFERWRREAAAALIEAEDDGPPDAFARIAAAAALMRQPVEQ